MMFNMEIVMVAIKNDVNDDDDDDDDDEDDNDDDDNNDNDDDDDDDDDGYDKYGDLMVVILFGASLYGLQSNAIECSCSNCVCNREKTGRMETITSG